MVTVKKPAANQAKQQLIKQLLTTDGSKILLPQNSQKIAEIGLRKSAYSAGDFLGSTKVLLLRYWGPAEFAENAENESAQICVICGRFLGLHKGSVGSRRMRRKTRPLAKVRFQERLLEQFSKECIVKRWNAMQKSIS